MKNLFTLFLCIFIYCNTSWAQSNEVPKNRSVNIHVDFGAGYLGAANINLEKTFTASESGKLELLGRAGMAYIFLPGVLCDNENGVFATTGLTLLIGKGKHHFEISGGSHFKIWEDSNDEGGIFSCDGDLNTIVPLVEIGYRYQKPEGGFLFRAHIGTSGVAIGLGTSL
jgi:hypothetical protein